MTTYERAARQSLGAVVLLLASASIAGGSASFFAYSTLPFPYEATNLISSVPPVSLEPHEVLVEGYALNRSGRPIQSVAVYPGALNQPSDTIPGSLAVTDSNGFFSIIIDRDRYTHLADECLAPSKRREQPGPVIALGQIVLPRADVSQAERTFRLDMPRRTFRCPYPIEGPPAGRYILQ
jgi:hypothetical protein